MATMTATTIQNSAMRRYRRSEGDPSCSIPRHGRTGRAGTEIAYLAISVVGGVLAAWGGYSLGRAFR